MAAMEDMVVVSGFSYPTLKTIIESNPELPIQESMIGQIEKPYKNEPSKKYTSF